ncbi:hypothetical protein [Microbacterium algeriense]|uniref:hypothetical protein n=1 Tax=Microbacterium algeriense TaxID=2615184 RepID=UPI0029BCC910|nr:hypothetical protein [Microbacterium algeriense]MDX2399790.1 hypothetical protein [Microbacterium algeriense]
MTTRSETSPRSRRERGGWLREFARDESGDVPGWVLVTLMTAGLVVLIWAVAGPALTSLFEQAIQRVSGL